MQQRLYDPKSKVFNMWTIKVKMCQPFFMVYASAVEIIMLFHKYLFTYACYI